MKTSFLLFVSFFLFTTLFSQSIIRFSTDYIFPGQYFYGRVTGYKTHFKQADSSKVSLYSDNDTIQFWVKNAVSDTYLNISIPTLSLSGSVYKISVENSIDSLMSLPYAFTVLDTTLHLSTGSAMPLGRSAINSNSKVLIQLSNIKSIANIYDSAFYIQPGVDAIGVDSIVDMANYEVSVYSFIPATAKPGKYDLFIYKNQDSMIITPGAMFLSNPLELQIDSISPDSISNDHWTPWHTIYVYGNNTHFTNDSNVIMNSMFLYNSVPDSIQVINDTLLKFNVKLPLPVKQAVNPNSILYVYNPTDGLLEYPMSVVYVGAIGDAHNSFDAVKLFPNPASDYLWIESDEFSNEKLNIQLINLSGQILVEYNFANQTRIRLPINKLSSGIYFVYIQGQKKYELIKFIKR